MPNQWIIHVRGPRFHFDRDPPGNLKRAMESVLKLADQHEMVKIAVPAISMGIYGYPPDEAVLILVKTTIDCLRETKTLDEVRFVILQPALAKQFQQMLRARLQFRSQR